MAETFNKMKIDVNEEINDIITEVQGDQNSRYLDVYLYNNGVPIDLTGHTVRIYMCRPKTEPLEEIFNDGEITDAVAGRCQFLLTTQALAKTGYLEMQITIWKGTEQILSTHAFKIMVTKNLMSDGSVEASNEYGALVVLFQNLYEAMDLMTEMVQNIGVPAEVADKYDLTTMWQCWEFMVAYLKGDLTDKIDEAIANASVQGVLDIIGAPGDIDGNTLFGNGAFKGNKAFTYSGKYSYTFSKNTTVTDKLLVDIYFDEPFLDFENIIPIVFANRNGSGEGVKLVGKGCSSDMGSTGTYIHTTSSIKYNLSADKITILISGTTDSGVGDYTTNTVAYDIGIIVLPAMK